MTEQAFGLGKHDYKARRFGIAATVSGVRRCVVQTRADLLQVLLFLGPYTSSLEGSLVVVLQPKYLRIYIYNTSFTNFGDLFVPVLGPRKVLQAMNSSSLSFSGRTSQLLLSFSSFPHAAEEDATAPALSLLSAESVPSPQHLRINCCT